MNDLQIGDRVALQERGRSDWWGTVMTIRNGTADLKMDGGALRSVVLDRVRPLFAVEVVTRDDQPERPRNLRQP